MKSAKRFVLFTLCIISVVALSICTYAKPSRKKVRKAYKTYTAKNLSPKHKEDRPKADYIDVNGDGIDEMLYSYNAAGAQRGVEVFTYRKGGTSY